MRLSLSISPCPNDTFMMDAIINRKINLHGYEFDVTFQDIDLLNREAKNSSADITKISCGVLPAILGEYQVLNSGAALGVGNAPLLVSRHKIYPDELHHCKVAIPGFDTTAALLLKYTFPQVKELKSYLFSNIAEAIIADEVDAGVLIHEERFVYKQKSLQLIADLSDKWQEQLKLPIPLGLIAIKSGIDQRVKTDIAQLIQESIAFGFANPHSSWSFIKEHARYINDDVIESHIKMFVNDFSLDMGDSGRDSIMKMIELSGIDINAQNKIFI
ncbi:MAG: 1,4-dihydroxy-6-naphthoate synthase [Rikenellaceae bacterium]